MASSSSLLSSLHTNNVNHSSSNSSNSSSNNDASIGSSMIVLPSIEVMDRITGDTIIKQWARQLSTLTLQSVINTLNHEVAIRPQQPVRGPTIDNVIPPTPSMTSIAELPTAERIGEPSPPKQVFQLLQLQL
jgi:hypothetical protein